MSNRLFAFESGVAALSAKRLYAYDLVAGSGWTLLLTGFPDTPITGCWDGGKLYMLAYRGTSGSYEERLYSLDPSSPAWTVCGPNTSIINDARGSMVSDGNYIYFNINTSFYRYDPVANTITSLSFASGFSNCELIWDYSTNIYALNASQCGRFDTITQTWTILTGPPNSGTAKSGNYTNGYLYIFTQSNQWRMPVPNGTSWESLSGSGANSDGGQAQTDDKFVYVNGSGGAFLKYNFVTGVQGATLSPPSGVTLVNAVYEIPIQAVFTFLEADGITPMLVTEPLGGSNARYYSGQIAGPFLFTLKCAAVRQSVQLQVVPDATTDITASVEIAPSAGGPWAQIAQLGAYSAGQVKPFYIRFTVPNGSAPALKEFALIASSQ